MGLLICHNLSPANRIGIHPRCLPCTVFPFRNEGWCRLPREPGLSFLPCESLPH